MADFADSADDKIEAFLSESIKRVIAEQDNTPSSGICDECGSPIEPKRLKIIPSAKLCAPCALVAEEAKRMMRRTGR